MFAAAKDLRARGRVGHEHDWCEIPLHEDCCVCARCGQVQKTILVLSSWSDTPDERRSGEPVLTFTI
jgi:hypothetical protein